jgi:hypothetical protein
VSKTTAPHSRVARWYIFKPKISIWVNFGGFCNVKMAVYFVANRSIFPSFVYVLWSFDIFCGHLVYLTVLVCCTKKNLATLPHPPTVFFRNSISEKKFVYTVQEKSGSTEKKSVYFVSIKSLGGSTVTRWAVQKFAQTVAQPLFDKIM